MPENNNSQQNQQNTEETKVGGTPNKEPANTEPGVRNLKKIPVNSSNLDWVAYDEQKKELYIQFRSGGLYRYDKVPKKIYQGLMEAGSLGRYHNIYIKWKYKYTKLN